MKPSLGMLLLLALPAWAPREPATASRTVTIVATDYAFQLPAELPAGRVTFVLENRGKVRHELSVALLAPGVSMDQLVAATRKRQGGQRNLRAPVGILVARAGRSSDGQLSTTLLPGRDYAIVCTFSDGDGPPHIELGMYGMIHVVTAGAISTAELPADTIIGMDYAYRAPITLSPGLHGFAFLNSGKMRHEADMILLRKGTDPAAALAARRNGADVDSLFEAAIGALIAAPGTSTLGTLETTLLPGRDYLITCGLKDNPLAPRHFMLGMDAVIHVRDRRH